MAFGKLMVIVGKLMVIGFLLKTLPFPESWGFVDPFTFLSFFFSFCYWQSLQVWGLQCCLRCVNTRFWGDGDWHSWFSLFLVCSSFVVIVIFFDFCGHCCGGVCFVKACVKHVWGISWNCYVILYFLSSIFGFNEIYIGVWTWPLA